MMHDLSCATPDLSEVPHYGVAAMIDNQNSVPACPAGSWTILIFRSFLHPNDHWPLLHVCTALGTVHEIDEFSMNLFASRGEVSMVAASQQCAIAVELKTAGMVP